jgi:hypothetical protein
MAGNPRQNNLPSAKTDASDSRPRGAAVRALTRATGALRARPRATIGAAVAALAVTSGAILLLQPGHNGPTSVDPRTRVFANYSACLLTGPGGVSTQPASAIWKGMQQASNTTNERVTNQSIIGPQTTQNAEQYINTLAALRCQVVITIGQDAAGAAVSRATAYPDVQFPSIAGLRS